MPVLKFYSFMVLWFIESFLLPFLGHSQVVSFESESEKNYIETPSLKNTPLFLETQTPDVVSQEVWPGEKTMVGGEEKRVWSTAPLKGLTLTPTPYVPQLIVPQVLIRSRKK
jgi:hypothetical protein